MLLFDNDIAPDCAILMKRGTFIMRFRELPDMMSALEGEGGLGKADVVRNVA